MNRQIARLSVATLVLTVKYKPDNTATNSDTCTMVCGTGTWMANHVPAQGGSPTGQVSSEDHRTATSSGTATMPRARKKANRPAVKSTTWMACDTTITATTLTCSASDSGVRAGALTSQSRRHLPQLAGEVHHHGEHQQWQRPAHQGA